MIETYLQKHYSPDTAKAYKREIAIYLSNYPMAGKANYKDITHYIGLLRKRYSKASTLSRILSSIKVYYDYLCYEGIRNDNPTKAIKLREYSYRIYLQQKS
jgi:integrase/recombinase XerD